MTEDFESENIRHAKMAEDFESESTRHAKMAAECIGYFRERPVFARLLRGFREKYLSYGYFAGSVVVRNLTEEDRLDLEGFLLRNYHGKRSATVRADQFREALCGSRFGKISPEEVLQLYFGEELIGKKERERTLQQGRMAIFERAKERFAGTMAAMWIEAVRESHEEAKEKKCEEIEIDDEDTGSDEDERRDEDERSDEDERKDEYKKGNEDKIRNEDQGSNKDKIREEDQGSSEGKRGDKDKGSDKGKRSNEDKISDGDKRSGEDKESDENKRSKADGVASRRNRTWLRNRYRESGQSPEILEQDLNLGAAIINGFPCRTGEREYLAVFAARITGNPHAFDDGTRGGQLLELTVLWELEQTENDVPGDEIFPAMRRQKRYLAVGILRDDISNYAMLCGVRVWKKDENRLTDVSAEEKCEQHAGVLSCENNGNFGNDAGPGKNSGDLRGDAGQGKNGGDLRGDAGSGKNSENLHGETMPGRKYGGLHAGMEGFRQEGEPVQVPLSVIAGWEQVACSNNTIYMVENPSVYAMLCQKWHGTQACMCMNGQPRLAAVLMLDLLAEAGVTVFYAGDFDPEGLLIAQRVKQYYHGEKHQTLRFWHMTEDDCLASLSGETLDERRIKMLERITDPELKKPAELLRERGVAGYQENIWERYCE
ncbi:MAG: TIGR02679 domain-containing protein [Lachnospiraceae bacterium]|nr:TIGR02679 domain-containing protein [Lachnospiraceae bacterium]